MFFQDFLFITLTPYSSLRCKTPEISGLHHYCFLLFINILFSYHCRDIEMLALFVACLCHDIDHRGTTNSFQVSSVGSQSWFSRLLFEQFPGLMFGGVYLFCTFACIIRVPRLRRCIVQKDLCWRYAVSVVYYIQLFGHFSV